MRQDKRKPKQVKAKATTTTESGDAGHVSYRRSRQLARRLMRRGAFNRRIADEQQPRTGRGRNMP